MAGAMIPALAATPPIIAPDWSELPTDTQQILAPLGPEWNQLDSLRKRKWLQIAERFPKMGRTEQDRIQRRMRDWAKLTPEERAKARERYSNVRKASPEQREALKQMWLEYRALPPEERERLGQSTAKAALKSGAATTPAKPAASTTRP